MHRLIAFIAALIVLPVLLTATSVSEPTFEQLVAQADAVFEGVVLDVQARLIVATATSAPSIVTTVSFQVARILKGQPPSVTRLEFLGGTVGDRTLSVAEMPQFKRGDEDLLFVDTRQRLISPVVGFMHGRFRIVRNTPIGQVSVRRFDGADLTAARLGSRGASVSALSTTLTLGDFENAISAEVTRQAGAGVR